MDKSSLPTRPLLYSATGLILAGAAALLVACIVLVSAQEPNKPAASPSPTSSPMNPTAATINDTARPTKDELKKRLTPIQYRVTCEEGTEPAFHNAYWDNHRAGIYVDVISGKALFSSADKFDSGTGWPSFTKPLAKENVVEKTDRALGMERTEVRAKDSDAHLGHVFDDGPEDKGGMRYCMNSASLRFIPVDKLKEEGYGDYLPLFEKDSAATAKK